MTARIFRHGAVIALYAVLLGTINILHFRWFTVHVVLYDTLLDVVLAAIILLAIYVYGLRTRFALGTIEVGQTTIICILFGVLYALTVPTIVDRSLSIYILEKIAQRGGAVRQFAMEDIFIQEYLKEHRLVDIRLTEAVNSGTVKIIDGCVRLTPRGQAIANFTRFYRTHFLPKHREIMGQLSDDLTDPFRKPGVMVPFACD